MSFSRRVGSDVTREAIRSLLAELREGSGIAARAVGGLLQTSPIRTVAWRVFLNLLPKDSSDEWVDVANVWRTRYANLLDTHRIDAARVSTAIGAARLAYSILDSPLRWPGWERG